MRNKIAIGSTYEERIASAVKEMEEMGLPSVKVIFRSNQNKLEGKPDE
jgi:hypothetical protein